MGLSGAGIEWELPPWGTSGRPLGLWACACGALGICPVAALEEAWEKEEAELDAVPRGTCSPDISVSGHCWAPPGLIGEIE